MDSEEEERINDLLKDLEGSSADFEEIDDSDKDVDYNPGEQNDEGSSAESEEADDSDKDVDYNPGEQNDSLDSSASEQSEIYCDQPQAAANQVVDAARQQICNEKGRKRKKQGRKSTINKILRNSGKEYIGHHGKKKEAKVMVKLDGRHNCRYKCSENLNDVERQKIFDEFWSLGNWNLQSAFICSCISLKQPARKKANAINSKQMTKIVTLKGFRVCKLFYIQTLGISHNRFDLVTGKMSATGIASTDTRGKGEKKNKINEIMINKVKQHILMFPKYSSHYSRRYNPKRQYLSPDLSISIMYKLYCDWCTENGDENVKEWCYRHIFNTCFNLSFHRPHTDTCNKCDTFSVTLKHETDETILSQTKVEQELHHRKAQLAVEQKENDKKNAGDDVEIFTFDLQKTLPTPSLTSNKVYYLRVLWTYNLGIHNLKTGDASMFMWSENIASRGSQEIGSCLKKYCEKMNTGTKHIIAYSDCCGGQNRNKNILKYWMYIIRKSKSLEIIDHKFLEPGHTYMECDQDFGRIEKQKKHHNCIYVAQDWMEIVKKTSKKFTIIEMKKDDFLSITPMNEITKSVANKDNDGIKILWRNIRWIRIERNQPLTMYFKESLNEDIPFRSVNYAKRLVGRPSAVATLPLLHPHGVKIKFAKYKNLQELKSLIPPVDHNFFNDLRHDGAARPPAGGRRPHKDDSDSSDVLSSDCE